MTITFAIEPELDVDEFIDILKRSTLAQRRPIDDRCKITGMLSGADIIVVARSDDKAVGVARSVSDMHYCTYLSDLAVDVEFQRQGIGKQLIDETHRAIDYRGNLILLAAPAAREYYPHIGMQAHDSCWIQGQKVN